MRKLYKRIDGILHFHEAWSAEKIIYQHWGIVGERGRRKMRSLSGGADRDAAILAILRPALDVEFAPIETKEHATLLIEYIEGVNRVSDLQKRHELEDRMDDTLGWTGLGRCVGGSMGSGTMEVCCYVVDLDVAKRVIESDLAGTMFGDFHRIYDGSKG
jgi:hypothetical protein